jgi:2-keto-4-pentenoate hydratase/2-oxohepta-3-ene-1,7-dioic acid hydratase in catechol pathway
MDHEVELALVIGKSGFQIPLAKAREYIAGYFDRPRHDDPRHRGSELAQVFRQFRRAWPLGCHRCEIPDPNALDFWLKVNGEMRQSSNTRAHFRC